LKNDIWQHLLGLQLVASSLWEMPSALCEVISQLMPQEMPERKADGQFVIPDISPMLERAIHIMANQEVQMEDVLKAVEHARLLLRGGRTPGEISPLKRLASMVPNEPPYQVFHQLYNILEIFAGLTKEELTPLFNLLSDKVGIDSSEISEEDAKDPKKMQQFLQEKVNTPKIRGLLSSLQGKDSSNVAQVFKEQLGFSSLNEAAVLLNKEMLKAKHRDQDRAPDFYDRIFHESQSSEATVRTAPG